MKARIQIVCSFIVAIGVGLFLGSFAASNVGSADGRKKAVESTNAPKAIGPYSQGIVTDDLIFLAGQVGLDPKTGGLVEGGTAAQADQAMKNLQAVLKAANSDFEKVVKTTIFLTDINDFTAVNEVYAKYLKQPYPARSTVQVSALPRGARVEIEMVAVR
ncbi:MAG: RidA family protein [Acidobacteriota bacterium]